MNIFLLSIMELLAVFALLTGRAAIRSGGFGYSHSRKFLWCALSSAIWSIGFGAIIMCEDYNMAYYFRMFGMFGTIAFLITAVILTAAWTEVPKIFRDFAVGFAFTGVIVYPLSIKKELIIYKESAIGTTYSFVDSAEMYIYSAYSVIIAILIYIMLVYMIRSTTIKRRKVMGKRIFIGMTVVVVGMVFDTILPILGLPAVPSSTIAQGLCLLVLYQCMEYDRKNQISVANIANYIDNSKNIYVLAYDNNLRVRLASETSAKFLRLKDKKIYKVNELFDLPEEAYIFEGDSRNYESVCIRNKIACEVGIEKIRDEYGDLIGYGLNIKDITEKNQYIKTIENAKRQADMANESKSAFLAQMSHEIRTPLGAVLGMNEMIMRETDLNEIYNYAEKIQNAGKSLLAIIDDILDISKIESGNMRIVENNYSINTAIQSLYSIVVFRAQKKGIDLKFEVDNSIPRELYGDELRIRQILLNIINNAIKYTKVGWVKVKVSWERLADNGINLKISVEDTGVGIKKEDMSKLFDKFQRFDERANHHIEGSGLGLSIVYNLISMMNGSIDAKSVYQRGSKFCVTIPQKVIDNEPVGEFSIEYVYEERDKKCEFIAPKASVLVVDDNNINLTIVKGLLKRTKMEVDTVTSGFDCLEAVSKKRYDIILLDHMMPDMDGIEVLEKLKTLEHNESKEAAVIALTANAVAGAKERYMELGFDDYISKPIDSNELENIIKSHLKLELVK